MSLNDANVRAAREAIRRAVVVAAEAAQIRVAANVAMAATVVAEGNQAAANNSHRPTHNGKSPKNESAKSCQSYDFADFSCNFHSILTREEYKMIL